MKALIDCNGVVIAVGNIVEDPEGYRMGGTVYGPWLHLTLANVPEGTRPQLDKLVDSKIVANVDYVQQVQQQAIDDYTMSLIEGGIIL